MKLVGFGGLTLSLYLSIESGSGTNWYMLGVLTALLIMSGLVVALTIQHTRLKKTKHAIKKRLRFEMLVSDLSSRFINLPIENTEGEIERGLERMRVFLRAQRITVYDRTNHETEFEPVCSVKAAQAAPGPAVVRVDEFRWVTTRLLAGHPVLIEDVEQVPPEGAFERQWWCERAIKSAAIIPLEAKGAVVGVLSIMSGRGPRAWPDDLVRQLRIVGDIFYQTLRRKRAEEAARESEERFRLVADAAPMMLWMSGPDKRCTYVNKAWLSFMGRTMEQEIGDGWTASVHTDDQEKCLSHYSQAFESRQRFELEYRVRRSDGEYRWIIDHGVPRFRADGTFCGYIGGCIDITDRKRSEEALADLSGRLIHAQEQERKRLATELHEDFSQRLVALGMELSQLDRKTRASQIKKEIRDLGARVKELSTAVHDLAHELHSSRLELLGLGSAVRGFCEEFSQQFHIQVDLNHNRLPAQLQSEVSLCLFRIVQEGLRNVAKHSGARTCWVNLDSDGQAIRLLIGDPGSGFDPAATGHSGLGLISMRERLRGIGGHMKVESAPSRGTLLDVWVPLTTVEATAAA
jgi:PAS domain S-box-containing protein